MTAKIQQFQDVNIQITKKGLTQNCYGTCIGFTEGVKKYQVDFNNGFVGWYKRSEFKLVSPPTTQEG